MNKKDMIIGFLKIAVIGTTVTLISHWRDKLAIQKSVDNLIKTKMEEQKCKTKK